MTIMAMGVDLAKNVFALDGVNETGKSVFIKPSIRTRALPELMAKMPHCVIGMAGGGRSH